MKVQRVVTGILVLVLATVGAAGGAQRESMQGAGKSGIFLQAASGFIGLEARDTEGEHVGEVRDILLDTRRERLAYVVIATGGVLGIGDEVVVVPWRLLRVGEGEKFATVPLAREKLLQAPRRSAGQSDEAFDRAVGRFYGIPPEGKRGSENRSPPRGGGSR